MKTLKKTLCLVLAVVMVLGLGAMSASATLDYADNEKITYKEAVDVMSGIGVLKGDEGGFRPTDTVRRSEAAKIIAYLLIGNAAQADALSTSKDPFTDVPASHWAAGYIAYCANAGIINGMGDGTFQPDSPVTGLQFAKMLLCAVGYNANDEYVNDDWAIVVSKDALRLDIFKGNLAGATNTAATREECALYAFNATTRVDKVSYSALLGGYITSGSVGADAADASKGQKIKDDFKLDKLDDEDDDFGRIDGYRWYVDKKNNIISDYYGDTTNLKATYTTKVTGADVAALLGKTFIDDVEAANFEVYLNGDTSTSTIDKDNLKKSNTEALDGTGNGVQTLIYAGTRGSGKDAESWIRIVIIDTYLAKVTDVKAATSKKDPVTTVEYVEPFEDAFEEPTATTFNTDKFEENDYVLVTVADGKIQSMTGATVKEGKISRYTKTKNEVSVVSGGTTYVAAKNVAFNEDMDAATNEVVVNKQIVDGKNHVLYVDEYGYLIAVGEVTVDSDYVYVAKFGSKANTDDKLTDKDDLVADIYYADGTNAIVKVNTADEENSDAETNVLFEADYGTRGELDTINDNHANQIYKLTMKKGKAILTNPGADVSADDVCVTKGVSSISNDHKADSKTVFFYVRDGEFYGEDEYDFAVEAFTGINSVPVANKDKDNAMSTSVIADAEDTDKAKAVLVTDTREGESTDTVYLYLGTHDVNEDNWTVTYDVYVNGKLDTLKISYKDEEAKDGAVKEAESFVNTFFTVNGKNEFVDSKVGASADALKAVDKNFYASDVIIATMDKSTLTFAETISESGKDAKDEFAYGYSTLQVIDLVNDVDDDEYISNARALEKLVNADDAATYTVAIQFADNASNAIAYLYIVDIA